MDGWTSIAQLPRDGRPVLFTRSVNQAGNEVTLVSTGPNDVVIAGHLDDKGVLVRDNLLSGESPGEDWIPTHFRYPPPEGQEDETQPGMVEREVDPPGDQMAEANRDADAARRKAMQRDATASGPKATPAQ